MAFRPKLNNIFMEVRGNVAVNIGNFNTYLVREGMNVQPELRERYENAITYIEQWLRELETELGLHSGTLHGFHILFQHPRDLDSFVRREDVLTLLRSPTSEVGVIITTELDCKMAWLRDQGQCITIVDHT